MKIQWLKRGLSYLLIGLVAWSSWAQEESWGEQSWGDSWDEPEEQWLHGFVELAVSDWLGSSVNRNRSPMEELRLRLEWDKQFKHLAVDISGDLEYDAIEEDFNTEFREFNGAFTLGESTDVKIGRQILTWGTGDLIFINDLFPKDWQSFFIGRDEEYLKAPSDAIRSTYFSQAVNVDLVYTPQFDADKSISGERLSFYTPGFGIAQPETPLTASKPSNGDHEIALRLFANVDGLEWAIYGYRGFFKSPEGFDKAGQLYFPKLEVLGASVRQSAFGGVVNLEVGQYFSQEDKTGTAPTVPNDQFKLLMGYETELVQNLTGSFQFYAEKTQDYQSLMANSLNSDTEQEEWRTLLTTRLTSRALRQKLVNSMFVFYSPTDKDWHLRFTSDYRLSDEWNLSAGVYWFEGEAEHTFWSQFQENTSAWLRLRYQF